MKAFQFQEWMKGAELVDVPVPEPGPGEVLVRIGGAGACHSDLHIMYERSPEDNPRAAAIMTKLLGLSAERWDIAGGSGIARVAARLRQLNSVRNIKIYVRGI